MNETKQPGAALQGGQADVRKQAAALMGSARTERKLATAKVNLEKAVETRRGGTLSEAHKAKIAATRQAQEKARKEAAPTIEKSEPKKAGRPRKLEVEAAGEKRGRGRPKKQDGQTSAETGSGAVRGAQEAGQA